MFTSVKHFTRQMEQHRQKHESVNKGGAREGPVRFTQEQPTEEAFDCIIEHLTSTVG